LNLFNKFKFSTKIENKIEEDDILIDDKKQNLILWEWETDDGSFIPFDSKITSILESSFQSDSKGSTIAKLFGKVFFIFTNLLRIINSHSLTCLKLIC
jgi:hypothetical protein